jgi:hypothetical protein
MLKIIFYTIIHLFFYFIHKPIFLFEDFSLNLQYSSQINQFWNQNLQHDKF